MKFNFRTEIGLLNCLLLSKILFLIFAVLVYSKITTLGDSAKYLAGSSISFSLDSTTIMFSLGYIAGKLPPVVEHLPLMLLTFYGLKYLLRTLSDYNLCNNYRDRVCFFVFFSIPDIAIWSSIHSKDSIGFFATSIIISFLIRLNFKERKFPNLIETIAILLCLLFKPQYLIAISVLYTYILITRFSNINPEGKSVLFLIIILLIISSLIYYQPMVDQLSFDMHRHFDLADARSTRDNLFYNPGDFYNNAFYGMFISFFGPTFNEVIASPIKSVTFISSILIITLMSAFIIPSLFKIKEKKFNAYWFSVLFILFSLILLVHYPFGVFNAGSAIRYRVNFMPLFIGVIFAVKNDRRIGTIKPLITSKTLKRNY